MKVKTVLLATTAICLLCFSHFAVADQKTKHINTPGRTITIKAGFVSPEAGRGGLMIAVFNKDIDDNRRRVLESRGIHVAGHLEGDAYWLDVPASAELSGLPFLHSAVKAEPADKITPPLAAEVAFRQSDQLVTVTVSFFKNTSKDQIDELLAGFGPTVESTRLLYGSRLVTQVPAGEVSKLAGSTIVRSVEPGPGEKVVFNKTAAKTSNVDTARKKWDLTGAGVTGGIWDEGAVAPHPDFADRLDVAQKTKISEHATHVAGTIAGDGKGRAAAEGMAPECDIVSFNFNGDVPTKMDNAIKNYNISFANNSWGYSNGWGYHNIIDLWIWFGDFYFGHYNAESAAYDELIYNKDLIVLFAAGNDRADKGTDEKYLDITIGRGNDAPHPPDGPYRTVGVTGSAKNVITVGAVDKRGKMTSFSSWGPTKDGRVKPEIVADGKAMVSTVPEGKYAKYSGTSMATPVASGAMALIIEQYNKILGQDPSVAEVRALIAATAKDLGNKGPDYRFGFGLLDARAVTDLIETCNSVGLITTGVVHRGGKRKVKIFRIHLDQSIKKLKIALAWTDPPAHPNARHTLVNDLDMRVYSEDAGEEFLPWTLDPDKPSAPAKPGVNTIDNIELVEIDNPQAGSMIIEVASSQMHKGNKQKFALVVFPCSDADVALEEVPNP